MFKNFITALKASARSLFGNWTTLLAFIVCYAALLLGLYFLITMPDARVWHLALSLILVLISSVLFFVLQTMSVTYPQAGLTPGNFLAQSWREFWKLFLISLPLFLLAGLFIWLLTKLDTTLSTGWREAAMSAATDAKIKAAEGKIKWLHTTVSVIEMVILYFMLPLLSIQLWISASRHGIKQTLKNIGRLILRAFTLRSVLPYLLGLIMFAGLPYYILMTRTPLKTPWLDLSLLGLRIAAALIIILLGWVITLGTIKLLTTEPDIKAQTA